MGTNYYAIPKADPELKTAIIAAVNDEQWQAAINIMPKQIHIGKSSSGWQFLFNHNNWEYFHKSRESINDFLSRCEMHDEYGEDISLDEFWEMVDKKASFKPELEYGSMEDGLIFSNYTEFS